MAKVQGKMKEKEASFALLTTPDSYASPKPAIGKWTIQFVELIFIMAIDNYQITFPYAVDEAKHYIPLPRPPPHPPPSTRFSLSPCPPFPIFNYLKHFIRLWYIFLKGISKSGIKRWKDGGNMVYILQRFPKV